LATGPRLQRILHSDVAAAWVLVAAVGVALVWANGPWASTYDSTWMHATRVGGRAFADLTTVRDWVNSGLMAVFFLVVGLEIGRERRHGDLADARTAVVPVAGALGGMAGAGLVYAFVNHGGPGAPGWGIPMATDIAFALGALALLGRRVPPGLRVFLLTLAVTDDIGSVVVLAVFYSQRTSVPALVGAAVVAVALVVLRRTVRLTTGVVLIGGVVLWALLAAGGVEPALAGVVAGLLVPARRDASGREPAERLERRVGPWSAFAVLPVFAVANAGITFHTGMLAGPGSAAVFAGVGLARVLGKLGGITVACLVVVRLGLGRLPATIRWRHLVGGAAVAGIGFTVPLLIAELAFVDRPRLVAAAELGLFAGSAAAFAVGAAVLIWSGPGEPDGGPPGTEAEGEPPIPW
jgi:NhaA family Na+:H+ antiporter